MADNAVLPAVPACCLEDLGEAIAAARRELKEIRQASLAADAEIRRLRATTRRRLERIWKNLRHMMRRE